MKLLTIEVLALLIVACLQDDVVAAWKSLCRGDKWRLVLTIPLLCLLFADLEQQPMEGAPHKKIQAAGHDHGFEPVEKDLHGWNSSRGGFA